MSLTTHDRYAIRDLYARYSWARSTADIDSFAALFTQEAVIEDEGHRFDGPGAATDYLRAWLSRPGAAGQQYWIMQQVLDGDSTGCEARSFLMTPMLNPIGTPSMTFYRFGHLSDRLVKREGTWLLSEHRIDQWRGEVLEGFPRRDIAMVSAGGTP